MMGIKAGGPVPSSEGFQIRKTGHRESKGECGGNQADSLRGTEDEKSPSV